MFDSNFCTCKTYMLKKFKDVQLSLLRLRFHCQLMLFFKWFFFREILLDSAYIFGLRLIFLFVLIISLIFSKLVVWKKLAILHTFLEFLNSKTSWSCTLEHFLLCFKKLKSIFKVWRRHKSLLSCEK